MNCVFDSSAMLALLRDENGADAVEKKLYSGAACYAHAVNLCEVFYDALREGGSARAENELAVLLATGIIERADLDEVFWRDVASLIAKYRVGNGRRLALGDAFGVALARRLDAEFVTADRGELERVAVDNAARIVFIR